MYICMYIYIYRCNAARRIARRPGSCPATPSTRQRPSVGARRIEGRWDRAFRASELGRRLSCCLCAVAGRAAKCLITLLRVGLPDGGLRSFRYPILWFRSSTVAIAHMLTSTTLLCYCESSLLHCNHCRVRSSGTLFTQPISTGLWLKMYPRVRVGLEKRLRVLCCRHAECRDTSDWHSALY